MTEVVLGPDYDVDFIAEPNHDLILQVCGIEAELRQWTPDGPLVLPIADEVTNPLAEFLKRRIYRLTPHGPTPFDLTWRWVALYERHDIGTRTAWVLLRLAEGSLASDEPKSWDVEVLVNDVIVLAPTLVGFTNWPNEAFLSPAARLRRGLTMKYTP